MVTLEKFTLFRNYRDTATTGVLCASSGRKIVCTLEPPNRNNAKDDLSTVENEAGCIPEGNYRVKRRDPKIYKDARFKDNWEILNVPNKAGVVFHSGNYWYESKSCILVCNQVIDMNPKNDSKFDKNKRWLGSQSAMALKTFSSTMPNEFELIITHV